MKRANMTTDLQLPAPFNRLHGDIQDALRSIATSYELKYREALYQQGDVAHSMYVIQRGGIRLVEATPEGRSVAQKVYGAGDVMGMLALSQTFLHPSRAEAVVGDTLVFGFRGQEVRAIMRQYADLAILIMDMLVEHVQHSHHRLRQVMLERVERRLARGLLHYASKFGEPDADDGSILIGVPISQQDMAQFTGATIETVNRTLKIWEERDIIRCQRQRVVLLDSDVLERIAEDNMYSVM